MAAGGSVPYTPGGGNTPARGGWSSPLLTDALASPFLWDAILPAPGDFPRRLRRADAGEGRAGGGGHGVLGREKGFGPRAGS
jgi:hypothetical protein